jgi:hypothetical protein
MAHATMVPVPDEHASALTPRTAAPADELMNAGRDRSFRDRTGFDVDITKLSTAPLSEALNDNGRYMINSLRRPALSEVQASFPVPPIFI